MTSAKNPALKICKGPAVLQNKKNGAKSECYILERAFIRYNKQKGVKRTIGMINHNPLNTKFVNIKIATACFQFTSNNLCYTLVISCYLVKCDANKFDQYL